MVAANYITRFVKQKAGQTEAESAEGVICFRPAQTLSCPLKVTALKQDATPALCVAEAELRLVEVEAEDGAPSWFLMQQGGRKDEEEQRWGMGSRLELTLLVSVAGCSREKKG